MIIEQKQTEDGSNLTVDRIGNNFYVDGKCVASMQPDGGVVAASNNDLAREISGLWTRFDRSEDAPEREVIP